jgi:hypothetical protein
MNIKSAGHPWPDINVSQRDISADNNYVDVKYKSAGHPWPDTILCRY